MKCALYISSKKLRGEESSDFPILVSFVKKKKKGLPSSEPNFKMDRTEFLLHFSAKIQLIYDTQIKLN